jgi:plastocyanin
MKRCRGLLVGLLGLIPALGTTADLAVRVTDARGAPVPDAVVTAVPRAGSTVTASAPAASKMHIIDQTNETFVPYLEVFRPGDKVVFHNSDHTRHHAYSFAPARQFEFVLAPGESSTPLQLNQIGVIAVGCNIHDRMITYLYVTDAAFTARTGNDGQARIDLPAGSYDVRIWHPRQRPGAADIVQTVTSAPHAPSADIAFVLALLPDQRKAPDRERSSY